MLSTFGASALGVLCLGLFGIFYWLGIFATIRAILAFVGTCLLGTAGFLGGILHTLSLWVADLANAGTGWATGVAVGGLQAQRRARARGQPTTAPREGHGQ